MTYGNMLKEPANREEYEQILDLAYPPPELAGSCRASDVESYLMTRLNALSAAHTALAEKNALDPPLAISHYEKILPEVDTYLDFTYGPSPDSQDLSQRNVGHYATIHEMAGKASYQLAALNVSPLDRDATLYHLNETKDTFKIAIDYAKRLLHPSRDVRKFIDNLVLEYSICSIVCLLLSGPACASEGRGKFSCEGTSSPR